MRGQLIEVNERLLSDPQLLVDKVRLLLAGCCVWQCVSVCLSVCLLFTVLLYSKTVAALHINLTGTSCS